MLPKVSGLDGNGACRAQSCDLVVTGCLQATSVHVTRSDHYLVVFLLIAHPIQQAVFMMVCGVTEGITVRA